MFTDLDQDSAYVLGFLCADGNVYCRTISIQLQQRDFNLLEKINHIFSEHGLTGSLTPNSRSIVCSNGLHWYGKLTVNSVKLCKQLRSIGVTDRKSKTLKLPVVPEHLLHHFVRGFFDGDGWMSIRTKDSSIELGFSCGSPDFIASIEDIITKRTGVSVNHRQRTDGCFQLSYYCQKASAVATWMYRDATVLLERKKEVLSLYKPYSRDRFWTDEEVAYLRNNYAITTNVELARHFQITEKALRIKASRLKIYKGRYKNKPALS